MYQNFLTDTIFFQYLYNCDLKIAEECRKKGCSCNKGTLHKANYPRKPRGVPEKVASYFSMRFSFCCNQEGCRKRVTPPSLRFMGRKIYVSLIILLVFTLEKTLSKQIDQLLSITGILLPDETLRRWRHWWGKLPNTRVWNQYGLGTRIDHGQLPVSLLEHFTGSVKKKIINLLLFLSPLTTTSTFFEANNTILENS